MMDEYSEEYMENNHTRYYRDAIIDALNGVGPEVNAVVGMFMNGDWEPLHVDARLDNLSLYYESPYTNYEMRDNRLVKFSGSYETLIYHLARIIDDEWMNFILNENAITPDNFVMFIHNDVDRGYTAMLIYRLNGGDVDVQTPTYDGAYAMDIDFIERILPYSDYGSIEELIEEENIFYL